MRKLIIILIFFSSCGSQIKEEELLGKWICDYTCKIKLYKDTQGNKLKRADTIYFPKLSVFDFQPNGRLIVLGHKLFKEKWQAFETKWQVFETKWQIKDNEIIMTINGFDFSGIFEDDHLKILHDEGSRKFELFLKKADDQNAKSYSESEFIGTFWKYIVSDSIVASYHFLDSTNVVINDIDGAQLGEWEYYYYDGISCLSISYDEDYKRRIFYLIDESGRSIVRYNTERLEPPKPQSDIMKQDSLLSRNETNRIKFNLQGTWESEIFETQEHNSTLYKELQFSVNFNDSVFSINYSGIEKSTNKSYKSAIKGIWNLSKTGEYIYLYYKLNIRGQEYDTKSLLNIRKIGEDTCLIGRRYIFLKEFDFNPYDNIKMTKRKGL
jgi:hypothetical protein